MQAFTRCLMQIFALVLTCREAGPSTSSGPAVAGSAVTVTTARQKKIAEKNAELAAQKAAEPVKAAPAPRQRQGGPGVSG